MPVAVKLSTSSALLPGFSAAATFGSESCSPPAAMAPGPAGLGFPPFLGLAFDAAFFTRRVAASSSASRRAFSALRSRSALRFSSLSCLPLTDLAPSAHLSASLRSLVEWDVLSRGRRSRVGRVYCTLAAAASACLFASFSAFLARPLSFFAFPPFGAIIVPIAGSWCQN